MNERISQSYYRAAEFIGGVRRTTSDFAARNLKSNLVGAIIRGAVRIAHQTATNMRSTCSKAFIGNNQIQRMPTLQDTASRAAALKVAFAEFIRNFRTNVLLNPDFSKKFLEFCLTSVFMGGLATIDGTWEEAFKRTHPCVKHLFIWGEFFLYLCKINLPEFKNASFKRLVAIRLFVVMLHYTWTEMKYKDAVKCHAFYNFLCYRFLHVYMQRFVGFDNPATGCLVNGILQQCKTKDCKKKWNEEDFPCDTCHRKKRKCAHKMKEIPKEIDIELNLRCNTYEDDDDVFPTWYKVQPPPARLKTPTFDDQMKGVNSAYYVDIEQAFFDEYHDKARKLNYIYIP
jgi:hypothetical protein